MVSARGRCERKGCLGWRHVRPRTSSCAPFLWHARRRVAAFASFRASMVLGLRLHPRSLSLQMSTVAGFGTGHCSPGLDMERRWCGMGGSGTGTSSAQPRRIVLGGAWRATARGRTLGRRRFGTEALARAAHAAAPLRGLTARAVAAACTPATRALRTGPVLRARHGGRVAVRA